MNRGRQPSPAQGLRGVHQASGIGRDGLDRSMSEAAAAFDRGQSDLAQRLCRQILAVDHGHFDALELLGILTAQAGRTAEATQFLRRAIATRPENAGAHFNYGNLLLTAGRPAAALQTYDRTVALHPGFAEAHSNRAAALLTLGRLDEALRGYEQALQLNPGLAEAWHGSAMVLRTMNHRQPALARCTRALGLRPHFPEALNTCGLLLQDLGQTEEAVRSFQAAISLKPDYADAHRNLGGAWQALERHAEAVECFERALSIAPDYPWLAGTLLFARLQLCDWKNLNRDLATLSTGIGEGRRVVQPFAALVLFDSPRLQRRAAEQWVRDVCPGTARTALRSPSSKGRIRLGYYSADFHNHATTYLAADLFETHDRSKFELIAFSFGPTVRDEMRIRVAAAFDEFIDARTMSDGEIVDLSRQRGIDIAIDLKGFTNYERAGIFAGRAAPVQVSYLGFPGTMGAPYIDYLIADRVLIPEHSRAHYTEKIVYLPHSYQANDRKRRVAEGPCLRSELGLPEKGFVFCCFNNSFKITPEVFDVWMKVLRRTPDSVLWLLADNPVATQNLRREAQARGVDPARLIFAPRLPAAEHLARHRAADLCLDTHPYNAHTTASDALWVGVPILTRIGASFAARVTASLLTAVGLPELVTHTIEQYEATAVELATDPDRLAALPWRLASDRLAAPLFDTATLTRHLEGAYVAMHQRSLVGSPAADIRLD